MDKSSVYDNLPSGFLRRMQEMLGEEYDSFLQSFGMPRQYGLRINTAKITCEEFERIVPFSVRPIPWIRGGYFYDEEVRPSQCPLYQAGLYYLQEPSAMTPAALLPVSPGDLVLDLCAAPGGKATALGAKQTGPSRRTVSRLFRPDPAGRAMFRGRNVPKGRSALPGLDAGKIRCSFVDAKGTDPPRCRHASARRISSLFNLHLCSLRRRRSDRLSSGRKTGYAAAAGCGVGWICPGLPPVRK